MNDLITYLLGTNHLTLGYIGVFAATLGLFICAFVIFPQQFRETRKNDGLRNTRLALPAITLLILLMFGNAVFITFNRLMLLGQIGSASTNDYRFFIGTGVGFLGLLLYIIYKKGGTPNG